jgi:hypothetical protein
MEDDSMSISYKPSVTEGYYPNEAGWSEDDGKEILLLSVPQLDEVIGININQYDYAWLFNPDTNAYIFCFQLNKEGEYAVVFQFEHAGKLLLVKEAYNSFSIAITSKRFDEITEETQYVFFSNVAINRQPMAGW